MTWRLAAEILLSALTFAVGINFWSVVKSPSHFARTISDREELRKIIAFFGPNLRDQATQIQPVVGSYVNNISAWQTIHFKALATARNMLVIIAVVLLAGSGLLSTLFLAINLGLFLVAALFPLPASAVNNSVGHVREVAVNLLKWHEQDSAACAEFCGRSGSSLKTLHSLLAAGNDVRTPDTFGCALASTGFRSTDSLVDAPSMQPSDDPVSRFAAALVPDLADSMRNFGEHIARTLVENFSDPTSLLHPDEAATLEGMVFFLHLLDRTAFEFLGPFKRRVFMDAVLEGVSEISPPAGLQRESFRALWNTRQSEYSAYSKLYPENEEPWKGTLCWEFAKRIGNQYGDGNPLRITSLASDGMYAIATFREALATVES